MHSVCVSLPIQLGRPENRRAIIISVPNQEGVYSGTVGFCEHGELDIFFPGTATGTEECCPFRTTESPTIDSVLGVCMVTGMLWESAGVGTEITVGIEP